MTAETDFAAEAFVTEGGNALADGRDMDAEASFRAALEVSPHFVPANYQLGMLHLERGRPADGLPHLQRAAKGQPTASTLTSLGNCFEALGNYEQAILCFRPVLEKTPQNSDLWAQYANLKEAIGQKAEATVAYKNALKHNPGNTQAAIKLAWILWREDSASAVQPLQAAIKAVSDDLVERAKLLSVLVLFEEWTARIEQDLPPYHATSLNDLFFHHATDTLKEFATTASTLTQQNQTDSWTLMTEGLALFASGAPDKAQAKFTEIADGAFKPMAQSIRFDTLFFDKLETMTDEDLLLDLPVVETIKTGIFSNTDVLYMSCNSSYFDMFAKPLLRSLADRGPGTEVHIHLMDSPQDHTEEAHNFCSDLNNVRTALSVERPDFSNASLVSKRAYYHAIRFIRYYHHFKHYQRSLWLMDVDGLFNKSPDTFFSGSQKADICLRARPGRLEPWNQFNACLVGSRPTSHATKYLHRIAAYIAHFYQESQLPWGIDQLAMYATFLDLQRRDTAPKLGFLNETILDYEYRDDSVLWCSSGIGKLSSPSGKSVDQDPNATAYDRVFSQYVSHDDGLDRSEKSV
ncbi:MAG: tetratricopeptide repeat protein [Rhodospirillaceae bacterium]|jgi:hypothetical protein|nr:tetratricopeptide repeat protein [Rhodospirillaceae bacterium]MBT5239011.1 tetratricopeptide repeat protein [Rhodospirillaceae bacterium]MBT6089147.1 tetratricopeptide repeat protein [Rhodospirillaceae bacterium]MBT7450094.1 tetratricopeptide repeat protein [Rhodospirillaceae bacterium]